MTTLAAGSSASVTNSGTSSEAVFDFGIPQGEKGDAGELTYVAFSEDDGHLYCYQEEGQDLTFSMSDDGKLQASYNEELTNLGPVSAYALAVRNGYTGTETEWLATLKGEKGDAGKDGEKGEKGDTGTAATITIGTVKGVASGSDPEVTNSGTTNDVVLNFAIPQGAQGAQGE